MAENPEVRRSVRAALCEDAANACDTARNSIMPFSIAPTVGPADACSAWAIPRRGFLKVPELPVFSRTDSGIPGSRLWLLV